MEQEECCDTCRFSRPYLCTQGKHHKVWLHCCRYAPKPRLDDKDTVEQNWQGFGPDYIWTLWPVVHKAFWCGEYQAEPEDIT